MEYTKLGFTSGQKLKADHMNHIEDGIFSVTERVKQFEEDDTGGGGSSAIIDVVKLPETDIREDVFYRLLTGTFYYNGTYQGDWTCCVVDSLPPQGEPVTTDMVHVFLYYAVDTNSVSGYIPPALSGAVGVPAGWYPVEALAQAFGLAWGGIIRDESEDPVDDANRLVLKYAVYYYKQEWINLSDKVGWRSPDGAGAEVFNSLTNAANGSASHAEGYGTTANGDDSHAEGDETTANGDDSHAEGSGTCAASRSQHVQGEYNIPDNKIDTFLRGKYAHIVGNGTSDGNRSNAHTLDWDGNAWYAGTLECAGILLTSPNGTKYKITVSDDGTLTATAQ